MNESGPDLGEENLPQFEQLFDFEHCPVDFDGGTFQPLQEALSRWVLESHVVLHPSLKQFNIFYELPGCEFVTLEYGPCQFVTMRRGNDDVKVWRGPRPHRVTKLTPLESLRGFSQLRMDVPPCLKRLVAEREAQPPREMKHWVGKRYANKLSLNEVPRGDDLVNLAKRVRDAAISLVQTLRGIGGKRPSTLWITRGFQFEFFIRYRVEPNSWWGPSNEIPPREVGIEDAPWPPASDSIRLSFVTLLTILEAPAAIGKMAHRIDHPDCPTQAELNASVSYLIECLPRLEAVTIELKQAIAAFEALPVAPVTPPAGLPRPKPPTDDAIRIYWLSLLSDDTQKEIARKYTAKTGIPMDQGTISRYLATVRAWVDAGNVLPAIQEPPPRLGQSVDPNVIDMGANREGRTKRQRGKPDDE